FFQVMDIRNDCQKFCPSRMDGLTLMQDNYIDGLTQCRQNQVLIHNKEMNKSCTCCFIGYSFTTLSYKHSMLSFLNCIELSANNAIT
ncbi:hypothetical protein VIGAN_01030100, partial [Vigna angularis var. angularis]